MLCGFRKGLPIPDARETDGSLLSKSYSRICCFSLIAWKENCLIARCIKESRVRS